MFKYALIFLVVVNNMLYADDAYKFINSNTFVKNPLDLRDPFKRKLNKKKNQVTNKNNINGIFRNYDDSLEGRPLENLKIIGVITGANRRAMAKQVGKNDVFILKEGMKIGNNQAEVKAILPGGVILLEKFKNVYDQEEYLETVLPVSGE